MTEAARLSVTELAQEAGVSARVIRYYIARKLLEPPASRGRGSHYTQDHLISLRRILELKGEGLTLDEIRIALVQPRVSLDIRDTLSIRLSEHVTTHVSKSAPPWEMRKILRWVETFPSKDEPGEPK